MYPYYTNNLTGKTVNSFDEITANDVPMSGSMALFPKYDRSEIEGRMWNPNGTISRILYRPVIDAPVVNSMPQNAKALDEAMAKPEDILIKKMDEMIDRLERLYEHGRHDASEISE